ncbi:hypothetical protein R84B8_02228 [Treponema sp. R8-4-B8]
MKVKQALGVLAVILILPVLSVCAGGPKSGSQDSSAKQAGKVDVKWDNDAAGYLTVQNDVNEDLILFAGSINNRNILGGVRKLSSRRVDFSSKLMEPSGTFLLRAVKESIYRNKGSGLNSDDIVFASLVVFDKNDPRPISINIQKFLGGNAVITIQNDTSMAMQIRIDNPTGPTLTTLAPLERNKKVYMDFNPDGYTFFPVYQYYDRTTMGIRSITAKSLFDGIPMMPIIPRPGVDAPVVNFDTTPANLFSPFATLIVTNETNRGVYLLQGSSRKTNQNGTTMINPGSETYELNLQKQASLTIGGLKIDAGLGQANVMDIPEYKYEAEYTYQVRIRQGAIPKIEKLGKSDTSALALSLLNE